jgi:hypothetical protein
MSEQEQQPGCLSHAENAPSGPATAHSEGATTDGPRASALVVACPYCHAQDVELLALFGAQLLTDQYYCNACHTPFEHVRDA